MAKTNAEKQGEYRESKNYNSERSISKKKAKEKCYHEKVAELCNIDIKQRYIPINQRVCKYQVKSKRQEESKGALIT